MCAVLFAHVHISFLHTTNLASQRAWHAGHSYSLLFAFTPPTANMMFKTLATLAVLATPFADARELHMSKEMRTPLF